MYSYYYIIIIISQDVLSYGGISSGIFPYPIIADEERTRAIQLGMINPEEKDTRGMALTARALFIVGPPEKKLKLAILYPATTGRNFE